MDINFSCPYCQQHFVADESLSGQPVTCPSCQRTVTVPFVRQPHPSPDPVAILEETMRREQKKMEERKLLDAILVIAFVLALVLIVVFAERPKTSASYNSSSDAASLLHSWAHLTRNCAGYSSSLDYDDASALEASGDTVALEKFWDRKLSVGFASRLTIGTKVYVEEISVWDKRARIRPEGSTDSYWVPSSAIR